MTIGALSRSSDIQRKEREMRCELEGEMESRKGFLRKEEITYLYAYGKDLTEKKLRLKQFRLGLPWWCSG